MPDWKEAKLEHIAWTSSENAKKGKKAELLCIYQSSLTNASLYALGYLSRAHKSSENLEFAPLKEKGKKNFYVSSSVIIHHKHQNSRLTNKGNETAVCLLQGIIVIARKVCKGKKTLAIHIRGTVLP